MVTQIPQYGRQRYTFNGIDDLTGLEFHNGDEVLVMDDNMLLIYDEETNNWYPIPTGGGGSEGGVYDLLNSGTYTLAGDAAGNMQIPVSVTGVPKLIYVEVDAPTASTAQSYKWSRFIATDYAEMTSVYILNCGIYKNASDVDGYFAVRSGGTNRPVSLDAFTNPTKITCYANSNTTPAKAGTYNWYVWGTTS